MPNNPFYWPRVLEWIAEPFHAQRDFDVTADLPWDWPDVGVPALAAACPAELRVPLRAVLRQAFLSGQRAAPLVDALADVMGWSRAEKHVGQSGDWSVQVIIPVRGAHEALRLCLECLFASELVKTHVTLVCAQAEVEALTDLVHAVDEGRFKAGKSIAYTTRIIPSPKPQSFAQNVNLGASWGRSEFIVLLNSDAFVGPTWLEQLLKPFEDESVVAAGPMGSHVSGHQNVAAVYKGDGTLANTIVQPLEGMESWTAEQMGGFATWHHEQSVVRFPYAARRLVGFCVAVRRTAWNRAGGMDERFANAYCDDDLSLRLSLVGKCVVVPDLLVLHEGQASFRELPDAGLSYERALADNRDRFNEKWRWILPDWNAWCDERGWR